MLVASVARGNQCCDCMQGDGGPGSCHSYCRGTCKDSCFTDIYTYNDCLRNMSSNCDFPAGTPLCPSRAQPSPNKQCVCESGIAASGVSRTEAGAVKCTACDLGYKLVNASCVLNTTEGQSFHWTILFITIGVFIAGSVVTAFAICSVAIFRRHKQLETVHRSQPASHGCDVKLVHQKYGLATPAPHAAPPVCAV